MRISMMGDERTRREEEATVITSPAAAIAVVSTAISLAALLALHVLSPEFEPSWRMVSEYANGHFAWLLALMFAMWGLGSLALAASLVSAIHGWTGRVGLAFLVLAGTGEIMAAFFDINHPLHGLAGLVGMPSLPVAAVLLPVALRRAGITAPPGWAMHLPWIGAVSMSVGMALFLRSLSQAGVDVFAQSTPLSTLPAGVTPFVGWANRLLVVASMLWVTLAARSVMRRAAAPRATASEGHFA